MPVFSSDILSIPTSKLRALFKPKGTVYYGWWIVIMAAVVQFICSLLWMQSYGAYTVVLHQEFGWSMTLLSGAFALTRVESGLLGPLQGWLVDRYGPRLILRISLLMFGLGLVFLTQVESILVYYFVVFLISIGISLGSFTTMVSMVNWFQRHLTKAVSCVHLGHCLGGLCVPMLAWGLEHQGWRMMAFFSGVIVLVIGIPIVQGIRNRPEDIEDVMDGGLPDNLSLSNKKRNKKAPSPSWKQSIRTSAFWHISVGHSIALLSVGAPHSPFDTQTRNGAHFRGIGFFHYKHFSDPRNRLWRLPWRSFQQAFNLCLLHDLSWNRDVNTCIF